MSKIQTRLAMIPAVFYMLSLLIGCGHPKSASAADPPWFHSAAQAAAYGLHEEQAERSNVLATIMVDGEELIFYEKDGAFGVGGVAEGPRGYQWYRSSPYLDFQGEDSPYMTGGFTVQTAKGQHVNILAGKVFDPKITGITVQGDDAVQELSVTGHSRFFFMVHEAPFSELKVTPILAEGVSKIEEQKN
ncbi:hypothetical protein [Paenibacillus sp. XY044]|uniref:hypothetical protein n=1 Tax=Paenibacillus sp. XY044 TaxID=2026089 RepID=UPI000B9854B5|nr:hypothetical protein [Paenibacillus sp. XY044]OZB93488.1 hypothetical protein CJP46_21025 [Paenibacillus sp. XY044]